MAELIFSLTWVQLLSWALFLPFVILSIWLVRNRHFLKDKWNLRFRRGSTVKVNFHKLNGRNFERYVVPNDRGIMMISGGSYFYNQDMATQNALYGIPEIDIFESQIFSPHKDIVVEQVEIDVLVPTEDGGTRVERQKVPQHVMAFRRITPKALENLTAQELFGALDSKIIRDIVNASAPQMQKIDLMFYVIMILPVLVIIGAIVLHNDIKSLSTHMDQVMLFGAKTTTGK